MYFVRRKGRIRGPLTLEKLQSLRDEDRLRMRDEIAESADGPWSRLADIYDELLGDGAADDHDTGHLDDDFSTPKASSKRSGSRRPAPGAAKTSPAGERLFGGRVKPWQLIMGGVGIVSLLVLATAIGVVLSPLISAQKDDEETAADATEPARPAPGRLGPSRLKPPATPPVTAVAESGGTPNAASPPASPEAIATEPAPMQEPAAPAPPEAIAVDHDAEIRKTLGAYYAASSWQERYRTALPGDDVQKLMRSMYDDIDWVSVQWSIPRMPAGAELETAAESGQPIRIDTLTNGNPHSIFLIFADGRWRIDWLQSLNSLWLSK